MNESHTREHAHLLVSRIAEIQALRVVHLRGDICLWSVVPTILSVAALTLGRCAWRCGSMVGVHGHVVAWGSPQGRCGPTRLQELLKSPLRPHTGFGAVLLAVTVGCPACTGC